MIDSELGRLNALVEREDDSGVPLIEVEVESRAAAENLLYRIKEVLQPVVAGEVADDDRLEGRESRLPAWFLASCSPEIDADSARELMKTQAGVELLSRTWALRDFLYWFRPENRSWYWWDARVLDDNRLRIRILVESHPIATGALEFLIRSAGADSISFRD